MARMLGSGSSKSDESLCLSPSQVACLVARTLPCHEAGRVSQLHGGDGGSSEETQNYSHEHDRLFSLPQICMLKKSRMEKWEDKVPAWKEAAAEHQVWENSSANNRGW